MDSSEMRVYVGTYGKYAAGDISGEWLDIDDFADKDDFYEKCQEIHGPGEHEFMFQDHEGFPNGMITESWIDPEVFNLWRLSEHDFTVFCLYRSEINQEGTVEQSRESFRGKAANKAEYVEQSLEDQGVLREVPDWLRYHIDFESIAKDWRDGGERFVEHEGEVWVFDGNV